jgi:hypothetical protein
MTESASSIPQNVQGWERTASIAGGIYLLGHGIRRGGIGGLLQVALGGMAVARGFTGRCAAKQALLEARQHLQDYSPQLDVSGSDLQDPRQNAAPATGSPTASSSPAATGSPTVTGSETVTGYGGPNG